VDLEGNRNLIDRPGRPGCASSSSLCPRRDVNNPLPLFQIKAKTEAYLRDSGMPLHDPGANASWRYGQAWSWGLPLQAGGR